MAKEFLSHISSGNINFAGNLYEILAKQEGNIFYSPFSAHAVLSLLYQGADDETETADRLGEVLHLPDSKIAAIGYQNVMKKLNSVEDVKLHIANKIFVHEAYTMKKEFDSVARKQFSAEAENILFYPENQAAAKKINDWVENKTNEKIKDLVKPEDLDELTRLVLVNAIYFKGDWLHKFETSKTTTQKFHISKEESVDCEMMHMNRHFRYKEDQDLDAQILSIPYKNRNLSLTILLPKKVANISELESKLEMKGLTEIHKNLREADVVLSLPKFKIETTMELNRPLMELGLSIMFTDYAEFPNMLTAPDLLKISKVIQKAFIEVNEEGAEAAAATGVESPETCSLETLRPISFEANHPFIFVLSYNEEEFFPLFIGKFRSP